SRRMRAPARSSHARKRGEPPMTPRTAARWLAGIACALPALAAAAQLLVNGVPIGRVDLTVQGLEGVTFEKCTTVKVEANGNVKVDCPGYDLQAAQPQATPKNVPAPADASAKVTKHYWLVTEQSQKGVTQFDIDL